jgi:diguanylate cyclase (GGDEF)-like protein
MAAPHSDRIAQAVARLAAALVAPLAAVVLRVSGWSAPWLAPGLSVAAAATTALATALLLVAGLRRGELRMFIASTAAGSLSAGLAVAAVREVYARDVAPAASFGSAAPLAACLILGAILLPELHVRPGRPRLVAGVAVFVLVEASLAASVFLDVSQSAWATPMIVAGAALAGAALLAGVAGLLWSGRPSLVTSAALLAGAYLASTMSQPGSAGAVPGFIGLFAAGIALAWAAAPARGEATGSTEPMIEPLASPVLRLRPVTDEPGVPSRDREESLRLARELRGTIEELMQAHRTIELQREEIARASNVDPLTGVASRRALLERLHVEAATARRYSHPVAVVVIDIDAFSAINRDRGLAVGDAVLRELALRMRLRIRAADALGRSGGDSFLAILPHTDERGATVFADALRRRIIDKPVSTAAGDLTIAISIGVAIMRPGMELSDEELLAAAEEALASARAAGGNRIAFDRLHGLARIDDRRPQGA